jgi:diguanylate cyclase (GGDEF)-like protein
MKVGDSKRLTVVPGAGSTGAVSGAGGVRSASEVANAYGATAPRNVSDVTSVMGIPENELTPKVREALVKLMAEVEHMRAEVDQQRARIAYLEQLADQDPLAPIANRRAFVRELTRHISFSERYNSEASVIYFDLNDLKEINDTHGHTAGDAALIKVANILLEQVRESDVVARLGGDEFGVLLAQANEETAREKARSLVQIVESDPLEWDGTSIALKLAFGVYTFKGGEDVGAALAAADRAMYDNKNKSRATKAS